MKHPKGLYILSFAEIWDRFSYYGIQAILVLYFTKHFDFSDFHTYTIYGIYTTLAFLVPILGGIASDYFLNRQLTILYGLLCMIIGNFFLLSATLSLTYLGLTLMIIGIGLFKANNLALVGFLYPKPDQKKETGLTIFYLCMNLGAMLGGIGYGFLITYLNWHAGFIVSIVLLSASLLLIKSNLSILAQPIEYSAQKLLFFLGVIFVSLIVWSLFIYPALFTLIIWLVISGLAITIFVVYLKQSTEDRNKLLLLLLLNGFSICYFIGNVQLGSSVLLYINRCVNTHIFGFYFPPSVFPAAEPLFVILLAPFFTKLWNGAAYLEPIALVFKKIVLGLFFGGLSYFIFALATQLPTTATINYPLICTVLANLFVGAGELCIAPALIFAVTLLAPQKLQGMFMGIWLLLIAFSAYLGSIVAKISAEDNHLALTDSTPYYHSFITTAAISAIAFIILLTNYKFLLQKFRA